MKNKETDRREYFKKYYQDNKERLQAIDRKEYYREYYKNNKDKIALKRKDTCICECGRQIVYHHKTRHVKSDVHLQYMESVLLAADSTATIATNESELVEH